jgi:hypothetical protein
MNSRCSSNFVTSTERRAEREGGGQREGEEGRILGLRKNRQIYFLRSYDRAS